MLKLNSSALGLLIMMVVAPSSPAAMHQNRSTQQQIDRELHTQKLAPIKKSEILKTKIINTVSPTSAPQLPSLTEDERLQIDIRLNQDANNQPNSHPRNEPLDHRQQGLAF